ncbi:MAG: hypothetical protein ACFFDN_09170 [Candidatus Hodarchaeota archaeon]
MSTHFNQYIIAGIKLPYPDNDDFYEKYESFEDNGYKTTIKTGLTMLFDGMCGNYVIIGKVLKKSEIDMPFDEDIIEIPQITPSVKKHIITEINKHFDIEYKPIKIYIVTHWH